MEIACFDFWVERSTTRVDICSTPAHSPISHSDSNYLPQLSRLSQVTWKVLRLTASQTSRQRNEVSEAQNNWAKLFYTSAICVVHCEQSKKVRVKSYTKLFLKTAIKFLVDYMVTLGFFALNSVPMIEYQAKENQFNIALFSV